ncbi:MAG: NifU N-terminal domain-containing protein [Phycisphaerales bacterium]|nr:NifU N-terminal domain-containing protein [Phycisphaerales bacterium]
MGYTIRDIENTPNPLARKLIVDPSPGRIVSVFDASKGSDDPLAAAILSCDGVTNVLVHTDFVSVCFTKETRWATLKGQIGRAIGEIGAVGE